MYEDVGGILRDDDRAILRITGESPYLVQDVIGLFADLDFAYASISYFFRVSNRRLLVNLAYKGFPYRFVLPPQELFLRTERLRFYSTNFNSPGFWEFLGKLNALEVIRLTINDYHERKFRKDMQPHEHRKRELENLLLENEVVRGRTEVLKEMGLDDEQISVLIASTILSPSETLLGHKSNGLITEASIHSSNSVK